MDPCVNDTSLDCANSNNSTTDPADVHVIVVAVSLSLQTVVSLILLLMIIGSLGRALLEICVLRRRANLLRLIVRCLGVLIRTDSRMFYYTKETLEYCTQRLHNPVYKVMAYLLLEHGIHCQHKHRVIKFLNQLMNCFYYNDLDMLISCQKNKAIQRCDYSVLTAYIEICAEHSLKCPKKAKQTLDRFLKTNGMDINFPQHNFALAIERCSVDFCEYMLSKGADVNSRYRSGKQAIHVAIENNSPVKVKLLLDHKVSLVMAWNEFNTPLDYAKYLHRDNIVNLLSFADPNVTIKPDEPPPVPSLADLMHNARHRLTRYSGEVEAISKSVAHLLGRASNAIASHDDYSFMTFAPQQAGSAEENTKICEPDEFDFMCIFNQADDLLLSAGVRHRCFIVNNNRCNAWMKVCEADLRVNSVALNAMFRKALQFGLSRENCNLNTYGFSAMCLEHHYKFPRLFLIQKGGVFHGLRISIDVVPCLAVDKGKVTTNGMIYVLPKMSVCDDSLPYSYNRFEGGLFQRTTDGPPCVRYGYILAKALRSKTLAHAICYPKEHGPKLLDKFVPEDIITSYMLKTCAITVLLTDRSWLERARENDYVEFSLTIYMKLKESLEDGKLLPYFAKDGENAPPLWVCRHVDVTTPYDEQLACCQLRHLRLEMCEQILSYLEEQRRLAQCQKVTVCLNQQLKLDIGPETTHRSDRTTPESGSHRYMTFDHCHSTLFDVKENKLESIQISGGPGQIRCVLKMKFSGDLLPASHYYKQGSHIYGSSGDFTSKPHSKIRSICTHFPRMWFITLSYVYTAYAGLAFCHFASSLHSLGVCSQAVASGYFLW